MKYVTDSQVRDALSFREAVDALQEAFAAHGAGQAENLVRTRAGSLGRTVSTMGAVLPFAGHMGVKVYSTVEGRFNFYILLFSTETGQLQMVMEANALTSVRTAATTLIAARYLARSDVHTLAVFGSGVQARAHAEAFIDYAGVQRVLLVDTRQSTSDLVADLSARKGVDVTVTDTQSALDVADIVVTATRAKLPLFDGGQVRPGTFIAAIGSSKPDTREVDDTLLRRCACIAVEDKEQALQEAGELVLASAGVVSSANVVTLGQLVSGGGWHRHNAAEITLYKSVGIGVEDIALAALVWNRLGT